MLETIHLRHIVWFILELFMKEYAIMIKMKGRGFKMSHRLLTVKGSGQASLPPDYIEISLFLEAKAEQYEEVVLIAQTKLEQLRECLKAVGISTTDLKTTSFNLDTDYEQVKDENGNYVQVFRGYVIRHRLKLGFPLDNKKLGIVVQAISHCPSYAEFSIKYLLKDQNQLKALMLADAVKQATNQAQVLAKSANVTLGPIQTIDYGTVDLPFQPREIMYNELDNYSVALMDLQPEDITATETVTIVWEIF